MPSERQFPKAFSFDTVTRQKHFYSLQKMTIFAV